MRKTISKIESMILDPDFAYLQPYFYSNPFALRCELGIGEGEAYMELARRRAGEIHRILFPHGADAMIFSHWIVDWCGSGEASEEIPAFQLRQEERALRLIAESMANYRHVCVPNLKTYDEPGEAETGVLRRNRMVCYSDGIGLKDLDRIEAQLRDDGNSEISLVSFENECILSVYDDRGCDVVFADREHLRRFYPALRPYFLAYDAEEMERRYREE